MRSLASVIVTACFLAVPAYASDAGHYQFHDGRLAKDDTIDRGIRALACAHIAFGQDQHDDRAKLHILGYKTLLPVFKKLKANGVPRSLMRESMPPIGQVHFDFATPDFALGYYYSSIVNLFDGLLNRSRGPNGKSLSRGTSDEEFKVHRKYTSIRFWGEYKCDGLLVSAQ